MAQQSASPCASGAAARGFETHVWMQFISETLDQSPDLDWLTFLNFNWIRRGREYFDSARKKTANKYSNNENKAESYCPTSRQLWMQPSIQWLQQVLLGLQCEALQQTLAWSLFWTHLRNPPTLIGWHSSASAGYAKTEDTLSRPERKQLTTTATREKKLSLSRQRCRQFSRQLERLNEVSRRTFEEDTDW